ncbi:MAG: uroporphyrinogen-III C-methyltransferase, partial [Aquaspirillum sp.]
EWRQAGMPETMPAAVIQHASTPQQRILISELSRLAADVEAGGYGSPAIIVLGEVVKEKTWRDTLPHLVSAA